MNKLSALAVGFFLLLLAPAEAQHNDSYVVVNTITVFGNFRTKTRIILRELNFKTGDTLLLSELDARLLRSKNNILNTFLFNFARIDTVPFSGKRVDIIIQVKERWYILPVPTLANAERNFNTWLESAHPLERESYGFYFVDNNFKGLKSNLTFKIRFGYAQQFQAVYSIPYIDKKQASGLKFGFSYNLNHEIVYSTVNDNIQYYMDPSVYVRDEWIGRGVYTYRSGLYNTHSAELRFVKSDVSDSVAKFNPEYFGAGATAFQLFQASYDFTRDIRDSKSYPLKGYLLEATFVKQGLGILKDESVNLYYGSAIAKGYVQVAGRLYFEAMAKAKLSSSGQPPYYVQRALGYGDYVRGYEYYVIDGQSFALLKTNFHYQLVKPAVKTFSGFEDERFNTIPYAVYLSAFADAAYVSDLYYYQQNPLTNQWLLGAGLGIDFVTYYSIVLRLECSINRMEQTGIYLHLNAPF